MRSRHLALVALAAGLALSTAAPARAQSWSDAQLEVWNVIQSEWQASMDRDLDRFDRMLHEGFQGWSRANPAPRDRDATSEWARLDQGKILAFELHPLGIVVEGNTAVAHYLYSQLGEDAEGDRETSHGRYTDVLVRDGDGWRFLAWHGGDAPDDD